jgi:hypothetical protein
VPPVGVGQNSAQPDDAGKEKPEPTPAEVKAHDGRISERGSCVTAWETVEEATVRANFTDGKFERFNGDLGDQKGQN